MFVPLKCTVHSALCSRNVVVVVVVVRLSSCTTEQSVGGSALWGGPVPHSADTQSNHSCFDSGFRIELLLTHL